MLTLLSLLSFVALHEGPIPHDKGGGDGGSGDIGNPALGPTLQDILEREGGIGFFQRVLPNFVALGLVAGIIIFFFVMLIGAIRWISAGSDKAELEQARARITNGLVGIVLLLSIFALITVIEQFFGINLLTLDIGPLKIE